MDDTLPPQEPPSASAATPSTPLADPASTPCAQAAPSSGLPPRLQPPPILPPPPRSVPPPIYAPQPSHGHKGGLIWKIAAVVAIVIFCVFMTLNVTSFFRGVMAGSAAAASMDRGHQLEEFYIEHHSGTPYKIAVIDIEGIITSSDAGGGVMGMVPFVKTQLKAAERDGNVKAVILKVNSPGGEVLAADDIYRAIDQFQQKTGKPVVVSMGSMAASGGYYVSAPCRWIVANELTITGSIGVIMHGYNYRGLLDKVGVCPMVFKSGKFKNMLSSDQEPDKSKLTPEERAIRTEEEKMVQGLIDETYGRFKEVVESGRKNSNALNGEKGRSLADNWTDFADGRVISGKQALELGFVDELGDFDAAVHRAEVLAKVRNPSLIQYRQPFNLGSLFSLLGKTETPAIKVDLGMDGPKLRAGYMYFITSTLWN